MFKNSALLFILLGSIFPCQAFAEGPSIKFTDSDRVLVIAPHPDDEALGAGGVMQSAKTAGAKIKIVYFTSGESNEVSAIFYQKRPLLLRGDFLKNGHMRKNEAVETMALLGVGLEDLIFFGYPDGGTLNIWIKYWGHSKSFRSLFTRINKVPGEDEFSQGHAYKGDKIVYDFEKVLLAFEPTHIFVTAPFDLNPDHQAAYLYLEVARLNLEDQLKPPPQVHLYVVHAHRWPDPKKYLPEVPLPIPGNISWGDEVHGTAYPLDPDQVSKKARMILNYKSQISYKKNFLLSFARANELFFDYPAERLLPETVREDPSAAPESSAKSGDVVYRWVGQELWMEVPLTNALDEMGVLSTYVFSYRTGFLFSEMPKLAFKLFGNKMLVYDGFRTIYDPTIVYKLDKDRLWIRIPMAYLKNPDTLFVSTRNTKEELSLDFGSWKVLKVVKSP
jgi:LmbE family N-acetylglucosaminyl deacetylase